MERLGAEGSQPFYFGSVGTDEGFFPRPERGRLGITAPTKLRPLGSEVVFVNVNVNVKVKVDGDFSGG